MNEQDQQLIEKYLRYIKKRRIITFVIFLLLILSAGIIFYTINFNVSSKVNENVIQEEINEGKESKNVTNNLSNTISENTDEVQIEETNDVLPEPKPVVEETKEVIEISKPNTTSSSKKEVEQNKIKPSNKDFLFVDGYNMDNVTQAAQDYLKSSGYAGECIPLKDSEGIYIGMRVIFY